MDNEEKEPIGNEETENEPLEEDASEGKTTNKKGLKNLKLNPFSSVKNNINSKISNIKKKWKLITIASSFLFWVVMFIILFVSIVTPYLFVEENINKLKSGLSNLIDILTLAKWEGDEKVFFTRLEDEYKRYSQLRNKDGEFDSPLIAATIHYKTITNPDSYKDAGDDNYVYDDTDPEIKASQLKNFYIVANDKLGTAFGYDKQLLGHLIGTRFEKRCVKAPEGFSDANSETWGELFSAIGDMMEDFKLYFLYTFGDNVSSLLNSINIFRTMRQFHAYSSIGESKGEKELREALRYIGYAFTDNDLSEIEKALNSYVYDHGCASDEIGLPVTVRYMDYDGYKKYLKEEYLPNVFYNVCETCEYKNSDKDMKDYILDRQIDEIFAQRDLYIELFGTEIRESLSYQIPGFASYPIPIPPGVNWDDYTTRKWLLGTAQCFQKINGEWVEVSRTCNHLAIDFGKNVYSGMPIIAIGDGTVITSELHASYGYYVVIGHDVDGDREYDYYTLYAHMLRSPLVKKGDEVSGGQQVGEMGSTGQSTGTHLHFELQDEKRLRKDPTQMLNDIRDGKSIFSKKLACGMLDANVISEKNDTLNSLVKGSGLGTRQGVVTAAKYLTNDLGVSVPYFYGGKYNNVGLNSNWGCKKEITSSPSIELQPTGSEHPFGLDQSGFVSWALVNGGYKASTTKSNAYTYKDITNNQVAWNAGTIDQVKEGDLAWNGVQVGVIVGIDRDKCSYSVAEAIDPAQGVKITENSCTSNRFSNIILMDDYYDNASNKGA